MKTINLRDYYPDLYKTDYIVEIPDEVFEVIQESERKERAYQRRRYRYKAHFSLDRDDGIENDVLIWALTPCEICEQRAMLEQLHAAIDTLPEKQAKRVRSYYFSEMSMEEIAYAEGVHKSQISRSIKRALAKLKKILAD